MRVAVTGANGFIGNDLVREFIDRGWEVAGLVRRPARPPRPNVTYRAFDLSAPVDAAVLDGVDAVVHCAYQAPDPRNFDAFEANVRGTLALFELAASRRIQFTFLSSVSALPHAASRYGRQKFQLEGLLLGRGASVVRPGLVVGDGGLVRALYQTMRRLHVIPLIDGGEQPVQWVGLRDLSAVLGALLQDEPVRGRITVAAAESLTARRLALDIRRRFRINAPAVAVPSALIAPVIGLAESFGFRPPITTESILGLRTAVVQSVTDVLDLLGVRLKSWDALLANLEFAPNPGTE